jgi:ferredoxin
MASFAHRHPLNAPGKYYVDNQCMFCHGCRHAFPECFGGEEKDVSYVIRQPNTPDEIARMQEVIDGCPVEAIGDDGDQHDWQTAPPTRYDVDSPPQPTHPEPKRPWWNFW